MRHAKATNPSLPEALAVAALTFIGGTIRAWPPGRLGMVHFDEGIYALAASWAFAPTGLSAIDPLLIPYSPPDFRFWSVWSTQ